MNLKLTLSIVAFILTFLISISTNIVFTSFKRGLFAFILIFIFSSILEKVLEREMILYNETKHLSKGNNGVTDQSNDIDHSIGIDKNSNENSNDDSEFQTIDYDKIKISKTNNGDIDIDNMDPKTIATILRNIEDDNK